MFVSDESIMVIVGMVTALTMIQGKSHNTLRRRKVEGSIHQYNISPSQTIWSTRFYTPKLRRLVLIIALTVTIDSRAVNTPQKQTIILALHTSYTPKNHSGLNPLYCWLMRKHTRVKDGIHHLLACIPTLTIRTERKERTTYAKAPRPEKMLTKDPQIRTPCLRPDPYLRHYFDQTKGYEGEGPEWQGDDLSTPNPQPDFLTAIAFINAD